MPLPTLPSTSRPASRTISPKTSRAFSRAVSRAVSRASASARPAAMAAAALPKKSCRTMLSCRPLHGRPAASNRTARRARCVRRRQRWRRRFLPPGAPLFFAMPRVAALESPLQPRGARIEWRQRSGRAAHASNRTAHASNRTVPIDPSPGLRIQPSANGQPAVIKPSAGRQQVRNQLTRYGTPGTFAEYCLLSSVAQYVQYQVLLS